MRKKITFLSSFIVMLLIGTASYGQNYYVVQSPDGEAHFLTIDISNGTIVDSIGVSFTNVTASVNGFNGMAYDYTTGEIYVAVKADNSNRYLGTINPANGEITTVGTFAFNCSSITFDAAGNLYGMVGNDGTALYAVDKTDASETLIYNYSTFGDDGEGIAVNTADGLLYRYDGGSNGTVTTLDLTTFTETNVATLANIDTWGPGLCYNVWTNNFVMAAGETFYQLETNGTVTELGNIGSLGWSGDFKGLVPVTALSVNEEMISDEVLIYPNPTTGNFNIEVTGEYTLEVVDATGRSIDFTQNGNSVSIKDKGVVFVRITQGNTQTTKKLVIQ